MSTSQLKNLLLPAIFIFNLTKSTVVQVSRKTQNNAALDILPYFLESTALNSLQRHGCWCAKLLDPEIDLKGKRETSDELDGICKKWHMSANCVHSMGGACDNYNQTQNTNVEITTDEVSELSSFSTCEISENVEPSNCLLDSCLVHLHFSRLVAEFIIQNDPDFENVMTCENSTQSPEISELTEIKSSRFSNGIKQRLCTGTAPHVRFSTTILEESNDEDEIDQQFGMACQQERCTIAEIGDPEVKPTLPTTKENSTAVPILCDPRDSKMSPFKEIVDDTNIQKISFKEGHLEMTAWQRTQLKTRAQLDARSMGVAELAGSKVDSRVLQFDDDYEIKRGRNGSDRLINGLEAEEGEASYYVRLLACSKFDSYCNRCGGTWITGRQILTAAHCLDGDVGKVYFYTNPESKAYSGYSEVWKMHECYNPDESIMKHGYDLAIITVDNSYPRFRKPIRLASKKRSRKLSREYPTEDLFTVYGMGHSIPIKGGGHTYPEKLEKIENHRYMRCDLFPWYTDRDDVMCFEVQARQGWCGGDSGGPIVKDGFLFGVVSGRFWNGDHLVSCSTNARITRRRGKLFLERGVVDFSSSVPHYFDWIVKNSALRR